MPANNPTSVTLDVRDFASSGDGWTNVGASNGATYSYKYSGGDQPGNDGSVTYQVGGGQAAITLGLTGDARYRLQSVDFSGDQADQLSAQGQAPRTRVINDRCSAVITAQYKVTVLDTTANASIPCDPMIKNEPRPPS